MKEILGELARWRESGEAVAVATVVATRRSAPRPVGTSLAVSESGKLCGSVSGGCVESEVVASALEVMRSGAPRLLRFGITDEEAWGVGLPCGGEIDVFVERVE
jgi:xanthine/CO dehydrogenase XdhC/CoxF family maturation factor